MTETIPLYLVHTGEIPLYHTTTYDWNGPFYHTRYDWNDHFVSHTYKV